MLRVNISQLPSKSTGGGDIFRAICLLKKLISAKHYLFSGRASVKDLILRQEICPMSLVLKKTIIITPYFKQ